MSVPGYGMVRQEREVQLGRGRSQVRFTDVAALIDPTTVTFTSLTEPAARVLEQNFQFDLVSTDKLLQKFIDQPLSVERNQAGGGTSTTSGSRSAPASPQPTASGHETVIASFTPPPQVHAPSLALQFDGDSWVRITGPDGAVVESGLVKAGEQRSYDAGQVARMVLGNAAQVRLSHDGQPQDLAPYLRANVARFTVSSDGSLTPPAAE